MAKKEALVCRPCGNMVLVSGLGSAVIECYECGSEMLPKTAKKAVAKKPTPRKTLKKKPAAKKPALKRK